jgi:hypothetical protein
VSVMPRDVFEKLRLPLEPTNRLSSPMMLSKCSMYLTLQRRASMWLCLEKRIVRVKNIVEEEEYNQFDEIPSFDTSYKPRLLGTNKTPYFAKRPY